MNKSAKQVYEFIVQYKRGHDGISPNLREINAAVGFQSVSTASYYVKALREAGLIKIEAGHKKPRGLEVVGAIWIPPEVKWSEVDKNHVEAEFAF